MIITHSTITSCYFSSITSYLFRDENICLFLYFSFFFCNLLKREDDDEEEDVYIGFVFGDEFVGGSGVVVVLEVPCVLSFTSGV